jgi:uncharacterized protein (TIGR00369 family)
LNEEKRKELEEGPQGSPFAKVLGLQTVKGERGRVVMKLPFTENLLQTLGRVHGGALFALADHACGWAVHTLLEKGERCATLEMKINYIAAVHDEACLAEARVVHKGRTSIVVEAEIKTEAGRLVAKTLATFIVLRDA